MADLSNYQNNFRVVCTLCSRKECKSRTSLIQCGITKARWEFSLVRLHIGAGPKQRRLPQHIWERDSHPHVATKENPTLLLSHRVSTAPGSQVQTQEPNFTQELKTLILRFEYKEALCKVNKVITAYSSGDPFELASLSMQQQSFFQFSKTSGLLSTS